MARAKIYGIKNCETVKKALRWLDDHGIDTDFHDYKKMGLDENAFNAALDQHGWENVINRRGISWRRLDEETRQSVNADTALELARSNPSLVKRPLLVFDSRTWLGFSPDMYAGIFNDRSV